MLVLVVFCLASAGTGHRVDVPWQQRQDISDDNSKKVSGTLRDRALARLRLSQSNRHAGESNPRRELAKLLWLARHQPSSGWQVPGHARSSGISLPRGSHVRVHSPIQTNKLGDKLSTSVLEAPIQEERRNYKKAAEFLKDSKSLPKIIDDVLDMWQDVDGSLKWAEAFDGAFVPVQPAQNIRLHVKSGHLPADLAGAYMRVGPNAQYWPPRKRSHSFDGDGMVHSVRIINGEATYHCQFLETPRYLFEREYGKEWFIRVGEIESKWGLVKNSLGAPKAKLATLDLWEAGGLANTAITSTLDGKLWALHESAPPFRFRLDENGTPHSVGYDTLDGAHKSPMSAHPKIDQRKGEILFHGRELFQNYFIARIQANKIVNRCTLKGAPIVDMGGDDTDNDDHMKMPAGFHHDISITENYIVLVDGSVRFSKDALLDGSSFFRMDANAKLRFGVISRADKEMMPEDIIWIEAPMAAEIVHTLHAYDEDGKIVLWAPMSFAKEADRNNTAGSSGDVLIGGTGFMMRRLLIDPIQKSVVLESVPGGDLHFTEYPRVRDDAIGRYIRYGYSAIQEAGRDFNFTGILKWDFKEGRLSNTITFPANVVGGEPVFLPKDSTGLDTDGDDGYIGMFLWNQASRESTFALFDARTFSSSPVVELIVPRRVPIGFHGAWISEQQFQQQLKYP